MFGEFGQMLDFLTLAPVFIVGAFLTTFLSVKIAQSDVLYQWIEDKLDERRAQQAQKIRNQMATEMVLFLRGRRMQDLDESERKVYEHLLALYGRQTRHVYDRAGKERRPL